MDMVARESFFNALLLSVLPITAWSAYENTVIATVNVGVTPAGLAITPDNKFAYVANNNNASSEI